ncbi:hypothetical protein PNOK_0031300 [Pyrrhoderma noxium]|uniref:Ribosome biogenesis protein NSA1 n=1 Tax=Pyrrhoderma noxium TaxID=2282107 RepID=A0A286UUW9_9AGAM|nr:hypothetical protein PNOK_0031300 [Pyrrhoderma noxium]
MSRFITGDELGNIKILECCPDIDPSTSEWKFNERILDAPILGNANSSSIEVEKARKAAINRLSITDNNDNLMLAASRSNGTCSVYTLNNEDNELETVQEWKETRLSGGNKFIGLNLTQRGIFWCASNGALGFSNVTPGGDNTEKVAAPYQKASLPTRLCAWRLSGDSTNFAYGGNEVDLSVWDTEQALQTGGIVTQRTDSDSKKRKRGNDLFPGEIWRAKNLPNDSLNLRQPIHITSLTYIPTSSGATSSKSVHIVTGTETGDVRRYDTRSARRPVANWKGIGKIGGIGVVEAGTREHELFVSDKGSNFSALDLRNGHTLYSYKQIQGSITSISPSPGSLLGSTSHDRFFRVHSTVPLSKKAGQQQEERGEVLGKHYMKSVPTAVVFDITSDASDIAKSGKRRDNNEDDSEEDNEDVWAGMQGVDEDSDQEDNQPIVKRR